MTQLIPPQVFSSLERTVTPRLVKRTIRVLGWAFVLGPIIMMFLPWQQNVNGYGKVSAFSPMERQQTIDSPVSGRIKRWLVKEGQVVKKGDILLEINDIDPNLSSRLQQQVDAAQAKLAAKQEEIKSYRVQIENLIMSRDLQVLTAQHRLDAAQQAVRSALEAIGSAQANYDTAKLQKTRLSRLLRDGLVSTRENELAERELITSERNLNSSKAALKSAQANEKAADAEISRIRAEAQARIDTANASLNKAQAELAESQSSIISSQVAVTRQNAQVIQAPQDGKIMRLLSNPLGQIIKQGDPIALLVPTAAIHAVEIWVSGTDASLILPGRKARLMFDGWPAVQFVGWPEVAYGTFGGIVSFVDAADDGTGKFRVLIVPDPDSHAWPSERFLRQGVSSRAWILLEQVPLGYEIWRQLNGFPPRMTMEKLVKNPYFDEYKVEDKKSK